MFTLSYIIRLAAIAVFAVSGVLAAGRRKMDLFGAVVLGSAAALGGGTIRDLILNAHPVYWIDDIIYLGVAAVGSMITFFLLRFRDPSERWLAVADAFGLALFTALGSQKTYNLGFSPLITIVMGMITGVAGGILRDILAGEVPLILRREIYATASLAGALTFVLIVSLTGIQLPALLLSIAVTLALRLSAIRWNLSLPRYVGSGDEDSG